MNDHYNRLRNGLSNHSGEPISSFDVFGQYARQQFKRSSRCPLRPQSSGSVPRKKLPASPILETLLAHKSVRAFAEKPLMPGTLELLVAAAQSASTSSNLQAWSVIALKDPAHKAEAATLCGDQNFIRQAPLFLVFCADLSRLKTASDREGLPGDGLAYVEMFLTAAIDAALAAQNLTVAAESLGLGTCYVGAARNHPQELADLLGLPPRVIALFGLAVGHPDPARPADIKPRLSQPGILHQETYSESERDDALLPYNKTLQAFNAGQSRTNIPPWTRQAAQRVAGPESLSGRHILRQILQERGFGLR